MFLYVGFPLPWRFQGGTLSPAMQGFELHVVPNLCVWFVHEAFMCWITHVGWHLMILLMFPKDILFVSDLSGGSRTPLTQLPSLQSAGSRGCWAAHGWCARRAVSRGSPDDPVSTDRRLVWSWQRMVSLCIQYIFLYIYTLLVVDPCWKKYVYILQGGHAFRNAWRGILVPYVWFSWGTAAFRQTAERGKAESNVVTGLMVCILHGLFTFTLTLMHRFVIVIGLCGIALQKHWLVV